MNSMGQKLVSLKECLWIFIQSWGFLDNYSYPRLWDQYSIGLGAFFRWHEETQLSWLSFRKTLSDWYWMDFLIFKGGSLLLFLTWWLMSDGIKAVLLGMLGRPNRVANHGGTLQGERRSLSYHELHETEEKKMLQIISWGECWIGLSLSLFTTTVVMRLI